MTFWIRKTAGSAILMKHEDDRKNSKSDWQISLKNQRRMNESMGLEELINHESKAPSRRRVGASSARTLLCEPAPSLLIEKGNC
jgi:hypothetical protein